MTAFEVFQGDKEQPSKFAEDAKHFVTQNSEHLMQKGLDVSIFTDRQVVTRAFIAYSENPAITNEEIQKIDPRAVAVLDILRSQPPEPPSAPGMSQKTNEQLLVKPPEEEAGDLKKAA